MKDAIDWASLEHCEGSAEDIEGYFEELGSTTDYVREDARDALRRALAYTNEVYSAAAPVYEQLIVLAQDTTAPDRGPALALAADILCLEHRYQLGSGLNPNAPELRTRYESPAGKALLGMASRHAPAVRELLSDEQPDVRSCAAFLLSFIFAEKEPSARALLERLDKDEEPRVLVSQLLALGILSCYGLETPVRTHLERLSKDHPSELVRGAALLAQFWSNPPKLSQAVLDTLYPLIAWGEGDDPAVPWDKGGYFNLVVQRLVACGEQGRALAIEGLLRALREGDKDKELYFSHALLQLVFHRNPEDSPLVAEQLTAEQRDVLEKLAALGVEGEAFPYVGLPSRPEELKRWLGQMPQANPEPAIAAAPIKLGPGPETRERLSALPLERREAVVLARLEQDRSGFITETTVRIWANVMDLAPTEKVVRTMLEAALEHFNKHPDDALEPLVLTWQAMESAGQGHPVFMKVLQETPPQGLEPHLGRLNESNTDRRHFAQRVVRALLAKRRLYYPIDAKALEQLVQGALQPSAFERAERLVLFTDALCKEHQSCLQEGLDMRRPELAKQFSQSPAKDALAAANAQGPALLQLARDEDPQVRAASALALAFLWEPREASGKALVELLAVETQELVRASQALGLGMLLGYGGSSEVREAFEKLAAQEPSEVVRGAFALGRLWSEPKALSTSMAAELVPLVSLEPEQKFLPWCKGDGCALVKEVLCAKGPEGEALAVEALMQGVLKLGSNQADRLVTALLQLGFGEQWAPALAEELTDRQRQMLVRLTEAGVRGEAFRWMHIPENPMDRRRWLGLDTPGVLERAVTLRYGDEAKRLPLFEHLRELRNREDEARDQILQSVLTPAEVAEAYTRMADGAYGLSFSSKERLQQAWERAGEQGVQTARALGEQYLLEMAAWKGLGQERRGTAHSNYALWAMVRFGAAAKLEPRFEPLVNIHEEQPGEIARGVLGGVASERREATALAMLAPDWAYEEYLRVFVQLLDLVPTEAVAEKLLRLTSGKKKGKALPKKLPKTAKLALQALQSLAPREPAIARELERWGVPLT